MQYLGNPSRGLMRHVIPTHHRELPAGDLGAQSEGLDGIIEILDDHWMVDRDHRSPGDLQGRGGSHGRHLTVGELLESNRGG